MRRSLASQYRVKTAHHLLNIVALKREMDTYSVDGLLKAASTGHSKEACLRYAGLQAALLIEKRALASLDGPVTKPQGNFNFGPSAPAAKPPAAAPAAKIPVRGFAGLFGGGGAAPKPAAPKPHEQELLDDYHSRHPQAPSSGGGGYTGGNYMINTQATKPSTAPSNLDAGMLGGLLAHSKANNVQAPGLSILSPGSAPPAMNNAGTASRRQAPAPLTAGVIPKPTQGTANATSGLGYQPTGSGSAGRYSGTKPAPTPPENDMGSGSFKPTADTVDPVEEAYSKQLNEGAATAAASKQQSDEDAYMKSIEPTAPTYPVSGAAGVTGGKGQEEIARQPQPQGRQTVIGSGAPIQAMQNNRQMRIQRRKGL